METAIVGKPVPVAGFVRGKKVTKEGKLKFRVVDQWFYLPSESTFAKSVLQANRVIVLYENTGRKYPKVISVIADFTARQMRDINAEYGT